MQFKVLAGSLKPRPDYRSAHARMFASAAKAYADNPDDGGSLHRLVFWGVRTFGRGTLDGLDYNGLVLRFQAICAIKNMIGLLTPAELLRIFPIEKRYDGARYQSKDYFFTIAALRRHGMDRHIGEEVTNILWDYSNLELRLFEVSCMSTMSAIRRAEGNKSLIEEFAEQRGRPLAVYNIAKDSNGRQYMVNNQTGEARKVYRKWPRYLRPC